MLTCTTIAGHLDVVHCIRAVYSVTAKVSVEQRVRLCIV